MTSFGDHGLMHAAEWDREISLRKVSHEYYTSDEINAMEIALESTFRFWEPYTLMKG